MAENVGLSAITSHFQMCTSLTSLYLGFNQMTYIAPSAFATNTQLVILDLRYNQLTEIPMGLFSTLSNLLTLQLSLNSISHIPPGTFTGAFTNSANNLNFQEYYSINLAGSLSYFPGLIISGNPLQSLDTTTFSSVPDNIQVVLSSYTFETTVPTLSLPSCCGLEFLTYGTTRYVSLPNTIFCHDHATNSTVLVSSFQHSLICPCVERAFAALNQTLAFGKFQAQSQAQCVNLSNWRLVNGTCQSVAACPPGQRLRMQYGQGLNLPALQCAYGGVTNFLYETMCEVCSAANCASCPGSSTVCLVCTNGFYLLDGQCILSCPLGTRPKGNATTGRICENCDQNICLTCPLARHLCSKCSSTAYQLVSGVCLGAYVTRRRRVTSPGCADPACVNCQADASFCALCTVGLVALQGRCVAQCPAGMAVVSGVCTYTARSTSDFSVGGLIGGVIAGLFGVVLIAAYVRFRLQRRAAEVERELRDRLLSSQTEASVLKRVWQIDASEIRITGVLGSGSFGEVCAGFWGELRVAIKRIRNELQAMDDIYSEEFDREVQFMQTIRHANIVLFFGAGRQDDGSPFLVTELVQRGSLRGILRSSLHISYPQKLRFARDAARGMAHLHSLGRIHRDLKTDNLLVTSTLRVKVADFGTACLVDISSASDKRQVRSRRMSLSSGPAKGSKGSRASSSGRGQTTNVGTPLYMAPEMLAGESYDASVDVYSFGVVLWEVLMQQDPWSELPDENFSEILLHSLRQGRRPAIPSTCPPACVQLLTAAWATDPRARPTFEHVLESALLAHIPNEGEGEGGVMH